MARFHWQNEFLRSPITCKQVRRAEYLDAAFSVIAAAQVAALRYAELSDWVMESRICRGSPFLSSFGPELDRI